MRHRVLLTVLLVALSVSYGPPSRPISADGSPHVRLTWVAVTTWLVEVDDVRFLVDAFFTRPPEPVFVPNTGGAYTFQPNPSNRETVDAVLDALNIRKLDFILSGHSHYDHSLDIPLVAQLTGAHIIGPESSCLQAQAQGLATDRCTAVNGGEVFSFDPSGKPHSSHRHGGTNDAAVNVYVIHSDHSGNATSILHVPRELAIVPTVVPPTTSGGFHVGVLEDMPNGGGTRVYLVTVNGGHGRQVSFAVETSGSSTDFENLIAVRNCIGVFPTPACDVEVPGPTYPSPGDSFRAAMRAAGLDSTDLFIGFATGNPAPSDLPLKEQEFAILHPRFFIPTHLGALSRPIDAGLDNAFTPSAAFLTLLANQQITLVPPRQFLDAFVLDSGGVRPVANHRAKKRLGLSDVQEFPVP
jgi:hypothetical protein